MIGLGGGRLMGLCAHREIGAFACLIFFLFIYNIRFDAEIKKGMYLKYD